MAYQPFLNTYVVWHPAFKAGGETGFAIAEKLYSEFSRGIDRPMSPALGIPIYFRTSAGEGIAPAQIDLTKAEHNVIVLLVNSSMVVDEAYRNYATQLVGAAADTTHHRILSFVWPQSGQLDLGKIQQTRLTGTPEAMQTELRMRFAAETCRLLQNRPRAGGLHLSPEPPMLFISHAKRDAEDKAEELKALVEKTPIDTFFDRADIATGFDFSEEILENIKRSAIVAWQSDEYGSRPWCNIELLAAKENLRPIVVVLGVRSGEERSFPYLGNVRTIVGTGTNSSEIIVATVREYLRKLYVEGRLESLSNAGMIPNTRFRLFRPPEPIDGALFERHARTQANDSSSGNGSGERELVLYPDPPISTVEDEVLRRLFPDVQFITPTTAEKSSLSGAKIALSISEAEDIGDYGMSRSHLVAVMLEIARHVLSRAGVIAYGGDLRKTEQGGFTRQLFQLVYAYQDLSRPPVERIWNFLAHHIASEFSTDEEAELMKLATFEKPLPPTLAQFFKLQPRQPVPDDNPEHRYIRARCLTAMREAMLEKTSARIVLGGRVFGHQGKYPGILEEAVLTLGVKPLYILGGFGGCAELLVRALRDKKSPAPFTRESQLQHSRTSKWNAQDGTEKKEAVPFEQLEASYELHENDPLIGQEKIDYSRLVEKLHHASISDLKNGLTEAENLELFDSPDLDRIVSLIIRGLSQV